MSVITAEQWGKRLQSPKNDNRAQYDVAHYEMYYRLPRNLRNTKTQEGFQQHSSITHLLWVITVLKKIYPSYAWIIRKVLANCDDEAFIISPGINKWFNLNARPSRFKYKVIWRSLNNDARRNPFSDRIIPAKD